MTTTGSSKTPAPDAALTAAIDSGDSQVLGAAVDAFYRRSGRPRGIGVRHKVLGMSVLLAGVTYLDRVSISTMQDQIGHDIGFDLAGMSLVFSAFYVTYAIFEIPTGWWADRIGSRRVLTRIVAWWSTFTVLTGAAFSYSSLVAIRALFGAGEAGAFPNVARSFARWFPLRERGRSQGFFWVGAHLAGGVTPLIVNFLLGLGLHWRQIFVLFGSLGFVWALAWWRWFRDTPEEHASVSAEELAYIQSGRPRFEAHANGWSDWKRLLGNRTAAGLCGMYFAQSFGGAFYVTFLQKYLAQRGLTGSTGALLAGLPLLFSAFADVFGGVTTDGLTRRFGLRIGRCAVGGMALAAAGLFTLTAALAASPVTAAILIALGGASSNFLLGASWGTCIDIGRSRAGALSGAMNTSGQFGAILSPLMVALVVKHFASWSAPLYLTGTLFLAGATCWLLVDPTRAVSE
jgi:MFS family permease